MATMLRSEAQLVKIAAGFFREKSLFFQCPASAPDHDGQCGLVFYDRFRRQLFAAAQDFIFHMLDEARGLFRVPAQRIFLRIVEPNERAAREAEGNRKDNGLADWNAGVIGDRRENGLQKCRQTKSARLGQIKETSTQPNTMKMTTGITKHLIAYSILLGFALATPVGANEAFWKPATKIDLEEVAKKTAERAKTDKLFVQQPTILALRTALYLSSGSFDTPTKGSIQSIKADFGPGEEIFKKGAVTVEFMGYADDSTFGERFTFTMSADDAGNWKVVDATREGYGRGDHK